jgi:hypothetical protein
VRNFAAPSEKPWSGKPILKISRKPLLALCLFALVAAGLGALLLVTRGDEGPETGTDSQSGAGGAPRGVDGELATSEPAEAGRDPRTWVLEMDGPETSRGEASPGGRAAGSARSGTSAGTRPLPRGSARIVFVVQDASGRPLRDVLVLLKSLDLEGGEEVAATGAGGEARFLDLAPGGYKYVAREPGGRETSSAALRLERSEDRRLVLRFTNTGLSIAGRVRNRQGEPIEGVGISVVRHRFASAVSEVGSQRAPSRNTHTDQNGAFFVAGLEAGEHDVSTRETDRYPSVKAVVPAGATSVELTLKVGLHVRGIVTNPDGEPLARVWVGLNQRRDRFAYTDATGSYDLLLDSFSEDSDRSVRFQLQGYEEERRDLPSPEAGGVQLNAELRPVENAVRVDGVVESERGEPVAGATVVLGSRALVTHYQSASDAAGAFSIPGVKVGRGYSLRVLPGGSFLDFTRRDIEVPEAGLSLDVVLESLATGRLLGRMVDVEGNPVPGFRLWVIPSAATRSAQPIASDEWGDFELAEAPAGSLSFDTRTSPRLSVKGVVLPAGGERDLVLVLDRGVHELSGVVIGEGGDPVAGAEVSLGWSHSNGDVLSTSRRTTRTNPSGSFGFSEIGPGRHSVDVRAAGYRSAQEHHEVGSYSAEVEIRLEPSAR